MKKIRLLPFVFKVKGARNYAFFDLLNQRLFQAEPEGDIEELKQFLVEKELAIDSEQVVPLKYMTDISAYKKKFIIRELQVRITGKCDANCENCDAICLCFKGEAEISNDTLKSLIEQLKYMTIQEVVITGGNPLLKSDVLKTIKEEISAKTFKILYKGTIEKETSDRLKQSGFDIAASHNRVPEISPEKMKADSFSFFYNQDFNPCWGNMVAIDVDGSIKPCLWSEDILGNINNNQIREMIIDGEFDRYWELSKDKIETCNTCEYRYGCHDCRVSAIKRYGTLTAKTAGCSYNPETGGANL